MSDNVNHPDHYTDGNIEVMDFIEEKKTRPNFKYTTYKGWLFGKAWKCYNESTHEVNMPERLNTIA